MVTTALTFNIIKALFSLMRMVFLVALQSFVDIDLYLTVGSNSSKHHG
jgi:hypothetical protein